MNAPNVCYKCGSEKNLKFAWSIGNQNAYTCKGGCMKYPPKLIHFLAKVRDMIIGWYQWLRYHKHREAALQELESITNLYNWYRDVGFEWVPDKVDFSKIPWISIYLKKGDCDDMMRIAEHVIKIGRRCYISNKEGKWHAIYVYKDGKWYTASNQQRLGPFGSKENAAQAFYSNQTDQILWEKTNDK